MKEDGDGRNGAPPRLTRRQLLGGAVGAGVAALAGAGRRAGAAPLQEAAGAARALGRPASAVVVGAGAFGGWTALALLRRGLEVTLLDAWGPGNSRASSGGESRVIRGMYGPDRVYSEWVVRSFELWRAGARRWGLDLYHPTGALWMFQGDDAYARAALPILDELGLPARRLGLDEARRRFPQVDFTGVASVYVEEEAGYLTARRACQAVARALAEEGGTFRLAKAEPGPISRGRMRAVRLSGGGELAADLFVFACGPWLGRLFPEAVGRLIRPTRQEVFYFGLPPGERRFREGQMPVWVDFGERVFYGVPGNEERGFKVADDTHGEEVDPGGLERIPTPDALARARGVLARRFPALAGAPLLESRVCQYENTPDGHYLIDRHPAAANVWLVGGGSGHGFKVGPALGERVAAWALGDEPPLERFTLARFEGREGAERSQLSGGEGG